MAYVVDKKGKKKRVSSAQISKKITDSYYAVFGNSVSSQREKIQKHTWKVVFLLTKEFGDAEKTEWPRNRIRETIRSVMESDSDYEVYEQYTNLNEEKKLSGLELEAQQETRAETEDPNWTVQIKDTNFFFQKNSELENEEKDIGIFDYLIPPKTKNSKGIVDRNVVKRSEWINFFKKISKEGNLNIEWKQFTSCFYLIAGNSSRQQSSENWWIIIQGWFEKMISKHPETYKLWGLLNYYKESSKVLGFNWLSGTGLDGLEQRERVLIFDGHRNKAYKNLLLEYLDWWMIQENSDPRWNTKYNIREIVNRIKPERDLMIDWRGQQWLVFSGSLLELKIEQWQETGTFHDEKARELPQWMFLRAAMAIAVEDANPNEAVVEYYEAFSSLSLIPSDGIFREAGLSKPKFLDDQSARVDDRFESVYEAMYKALVGTKWTGAATLDWGHVRSEGTMIAGRRVSQGVIPFIKTIDMALSSQGRPTNDKPITVILPVWHMEIEAFLSLQHHPNTRLQAVISVPDVFIERVRSESQWTIFDPSIYPEIFEEEGYKKCEKQSEKRKKEHPEASLIVSAKPLWKKMIEGMKRGSVYITFESTHSAFSPFPKEAPPVFGIDGVGAIPIPYGTESKPLPWAEWPAMAVNISALVDENNQQDSKKMQQIVYLGLRALDNAITASLPDKNSVAFLYRPVCLGAVGLDEALNQSKIYENKKEDNIEAEMDWTQILAENWAVSVIRADQILKRERGASPMWESSGRPWDPIKGIVALSEQRGGAKPYSWPNPKLNWDNFTSKVAEGHRLSVRSVWAPFDGQAKIAGVSQGGISLPSIADIVIDEVGNKKYIPTPHMFEKINQDIKNLKTYEAWYDSKEKSSSVVALTEQSAQQWERLLRRASILRPWIDQGVCLTFPENIEENELERLIMRAWWMGVSSIRFDGKIKKIDI